MNYSLIIHILTEMEQLLTKNLTDRFHWLCLCLTYARIHYRFSIEAPEVKWIQQRIRKATVGHLSIESALKALRPGIKVTPDEAYHIRKYLIHRWKREASLALAQVTR